MCNLQCITLFALVLHWNCITLIQSDVYYFVIYIILDCSLVELLCGVIS